MAESGDAGGRWRVLDRRALYTSEWVSLYHSDVELPDGSVIHDYHEVEFARPAVGVVPMREDGSVLMVDHERFIIGERGWEIPAGRIDEGEEPEEAGRRELLEEAGAASGELIPLGSHRPLIGTTNARFYLFLGPGARQVQQVTDTNEIGGVRWFTREEVRAMLDRGEVRDGMSLTGLLLAAFRGYL